MPWDISFEKISVQADPELDTIRPSGISEIIFRAPSLRPSALPLK
jgi:hypothetical protein